MSFIKDNWKWLTAGAVGVGILAYAASDGKAADLGGSGLPDLEERVAELEATTARKGNRKTTLSIYGQVNKSILYYDIEDFSDTSVIENGASESFVGFAARVVLNKDFSAGGVIEIGQGKSGLTADLGTGDVGIGTDNDLYTRQSYVFLSTPTGKVSIGHLAMATDDLTATSIVNGTTAATKRLTFQPLGNVLVSALGVSILELELEPFNGQKADAVRYDSPVFGGFSVSAAWESNSDAWDAAIRYGGELGGFAIIGALGFEHDKADDLLSIIGTDVETKTISANAGIKHVVSGIFLQGAWARYEIIPADIETDAWHVQGGIETSVFSFGPTTIWAGYMDWRDLDLTSIELGLNQNISGAVDAYVVGKQTEVGDVDATSILGGLRLRF
jgi:hypothetical protein